MTLLLVPGFMADATLWDDMLPFLPPGQDVHLADINTGTTIDAMARAILATAPPEFIVLGFSMGGYVARQIVYLAPGRARGLILVATSARPDKPALVQQRIAAAQATAFSAFHGLARGSIRASLHASRADDTAMIERVRAMGQRLGRDVFLRQTAVVRAGDVDQLATMTCPTLVIAADGDQLRTVDEARELADGIPGARLAVVAQSGHMLPLEAPQILGGLITQWLQQYATAAR